MRKGYVVLLAVLAAAWLTGCGFHPASNLSTSSSSSSTPSITVTGAASSARLGDPAVQFTASGGSGGYTWAVNGVSGGSATTGTIDSTGKYTPPAVGATTLANPTTVTITASSGGTTSAGVSLSLQNPIATVTGVSVTGGGTLLAGVATGITVTGTNFVSGAQVVFGSSSVAATVASSTSLTATVTVTSAGSVSFAVKNPDPGSATSTTTASLTASNPVVIAGTAAKGLLNGAKVNIFAVSPTSGADVGSALATGTTDANGVFSVTLPTIPAAGTPLRVEVSGGTYIDESNVTAPPIANSITISTLIDDGSVSVSGLAVTPITDMISSATQQALSSTHPVKLLAAGGTTSSTHASLKSLISGHWGITSDPEKKSPKSDKGSATSDPDAFRIGLLSGAMLECAHKALAAVPTVDPGNFVKALGFDIADGVFDGYGISSSGRAQVIIPGTGTPGIALSAYAGTTDFLSCLQAYVTSPNTELTKDNGIPAGSPPDSSLTAVVAPVVTSVSTAVSSSPATPTSAGIGASSSGAIGQLSFSGHQYVFVAAHTSGVAVADVTDPTKPTAKSWKGLYTTTFKSTPVGGVIPVIGTAAHAQAVVFAYQSKHIAVVNAEMLATGTPPTDGSVPTGLVDYEGDLPIAALSTVGFSGGSAYIAGGIPVAGAGVWLATADGYAFFDLRTSPPSLGKPVLVEMTQQLAENMGGDLAHRFLLGGNYYGIQVVTLNSSNITVADKSYTVDLTPFTSVFPSPSYPNIDANSVDTGLSVALLTLEDRSNVVLVDFRTTTLTDSTDPTKPNIISLPANTVKSVIIGGTFSGSAVDSSSHLALFMAGYSTSWAVGKVDDPANPASSSAGWQGLSDWIYGDLYTSFPSYYYATDPHAVGVVQNNTDGRSYGYLLDGNFQGVVQINMTDIVDPAKMPRAGTSGSSAHSPASDPKAAGLMTEITWP